MPRGVVDLEGLKSPETEALRRLAPPAGLPFQVRKLGHAPPGQDTSQHLK